jgi:hypothetical protein
MSNEREHDLDEDVGRATIVYEDPAEGTVEKHVPNEHIAYFQDHWIVKIREDDQGRDRIRRIPATRVHYVERTVDEFAAEVRTLKNDIESIAANIGDRLPLGGRDEGGDDGRSGTDDDPGDGSVHIDVTDGDTDDPDDRR